jgi:hypothetical protein
VQLFLARARRVWPDFDLENKRASVVRIRRLVEGMPLALELAAFWLKTFPAARRETRRRHGAYYAAFMAERGEASNGEGQIEAAAMAAELDNVRAAWG